MVNKENAKQQIRGLLEKYDKVVEEDRFSKYTEEETKKDFILPLFRALGWNVEDSTEVAAEETISRGRVDYSFRINGIPKFFLEAKPLKADLDDRKFAEQAINYAWHKDCTWAVLTDFDQGVKIFNAEWKTTNLRQSMFFSIDRQQFLEQFDQLWLLSRESFEQGLLDKEAEKWGKKSKKRHVGEQLLNDLTTWRTALSKDILARNKDKRLTEEELDEAVQRFIDRLIFIRNCEDRELDPPTLLRTMREWDSKRKGALVEHIREVFRHFWDEYDSELFKGQLCDQLNASNQVLEEIINGLDHTEDKTIKYDFSALDADILGHVYEQYLGHILKKTAKRAVLKEKYARRKEHGIYYTPTYIVDYIVRNTLGELLKDKKVDVEKIKVLDPACGSGSFLIKAFDILNEYHSKKDKDYGQTHLDLKTGTTFTKKVEILQNNIFGVDLDAQAVEIAQLNMLLKIAEKGHRLPLLQQNIKCGNSLIDDEKIADDKAFKWEQEFKQIMGEGGFDVVIGNPPWVSIKGKHKSMDLSEAELNYFFQKYNCDTYMPNLYELFIWRSLYLLKEGGLFSFIVPDRLCANLQFINLRKYILENFSIKKLWLKVPFPGIIADTVIFVIEKKQRNNNVVDVAEHSKDSIKIPQRAFQEAADNAFFYICKEIYDIFKKIKSNKNVTTLGKVVLTTSGCGAKSAEITKKRKNNLQIPILKGESISRYQLRNKFWFEFTDKNRVVGQEMKRS